METEIWLVRHGQSAANAGSVSYTHLDVYKRQLMHAPAAALAAPALSVTDLRKTYDTGVQALKGVSLQVCLLYTSRCV